VPHLSWEEAAAVCGDQGILEIAETDPAGVSQAPRSRAIRALVLFTLGTAVSKSISGHRPTMRELACKMVNTPSGTRFPAAHLS